MNAPVLKNVLLEVHLAGTLFHEQFFILSKMYTTLFGMSFLKKNDSIQQSHKKILNNRVFVLQTLSKITLHSNNPEIIECSPVINKQDWSDSAFNVV